MATSEKLQALIYSHLDKVATFAELTNLCLGAWPSDVMHALITLSDLDRSLSGRIEALMCSVATPYVDDDLPRTVLPAEHPLDFDWRFHPATSEMLLDRVISGLGATEKMLFVCAPSVALLAHEKGMGHQVVIGTRRGDPIIDALKKHAPTLDYVDISQISGLKAARLLIDPPWYDDIALPLLSLVLSGIDVGASVWICGPDHLTRPSAAHYLLDENSVREKLGIAKLGPDMDDRVRYRTPPFEMRTLAALGIRNISHSWRTGLARSYLKVRTVPVAAPPDHAHQWKEISDGPSRIWLRDELARETSTDEQIVVSTSVSRTNPLHASACVWTSNNTVVTGASRLDLELMATAQSWDDSPLGKRILSIEAETE
ncbi:hypothetical protein ACRYWZ_13775 [Agrobacterium deltaense]|uniref:hypothetical protein n=1 Tax=Agrobacterium deltaense TaxID=1183412 RepID=UPI003D99C381